MRQASRHEPNMKPLDTTIQAVVAILKSDPTFTAKSRNQFITVLRSGLTGERAETSPLRVARILKRHEAAARLGVSLRTLDKLSKEGALPKRVLPGRLRATGILETDLEILIAGKAD
jgi:predicted DNA-binding transcriptional regulator AlpA